MHTVITTTAMNLMCMFMCQMCTCFCVVYNKISFIISCIVKCGQYVISNREVLLKPSDFVFKVLFLTNSFEKLVRANFRFGRMCRLNNANKPIIKL